MPKMVMMWKQMMNKNVDCVVMVVAVRASGRNM